MQALRVPARRGFEWIIEGFRLFAKNPLVIVLLLFTYLFLLSIAASVPFLGSCIMAALLPSFSVGLLLVFKRLDAGEPIALTHLFGGFRTNFPALLRLGILYSVSLATGLLLSTLADDGLYMQSILFGDELPEPPAPQVDAAQIILFFTLLPTAVALWFAPMLAAWHQLPAMQSLFFGLVACLRNYRAFLVFLASVVGICLIAASIVAVLVAVFATAFPELAKVFMVLIVILLFVVVTSGNYLSYRDIFRDKMTDPTAAATAVP